MDIYPARELPIEGVSSDLIFREITAAKKIRTTKADLLKMTQSLDLEILATIGAEIGRAHV